MGVRQIGWARIKSLINENQNQLKHRNTQVVDVSEATTLSADQSGAVVLLDQSASAYDITLPAAAVGLSFTFVITVKHGSDDAAFNIACAGSDIVYGKSVVFSTAGDEVKYQRAEIAGANTKIVFTRNVATTGGLEGDTVTLVCGASGQWIASCILTSTNAALGSIATLAT